MFPVEYILRTKRTTKDSHATMSNHVIPGSVGIIILTLLAYAMCDKTME